MSKLTAADYSAVSKAVAKACRKARIPNDATADVLSATWIIMEETYDSSKGDVGGYAFIVARNVATDCQRNRPSAPVNLRNDAQIADPDTLDEGENGYWPVSRFPDPLAVLLTKEKAQILREASETLGADVMFSALVEELDGKELAQRLDCKPGTARVRKDRFIDRLSLIKKVREVL